MKTTPTISMTALLCLLALVGCSDSSESKASHAVQNEPAADTSYLDELAAKQGLAEEDDSNDDAPQYSEHVDEIGGMEGGASGESDEPEAKDREWVKERESQSLYGRSRDKAIGLRDQIQGGTAPGEGLADTLSDEEYVMSSGLRWEMPEDWRMAIPARGSFGEMYIKDRLGNASVSFMKEAKTVHELVRRLQGQFIDPMGGRSRAKTSQSELMGYPLTTVDLNGTYLDPGSKGGTNEQIFYAVHAVVFDMGEFRILIKLWGPEDTVRLSTGGFDRMVRETSNP